METLKKKLAMLRADAEDSRDEAEMQRKIAREYKDRMETAEAEKEDLMRKTQLLDDDITRLTTKKEELSSKLTDVEEQAELHIRATKALETRSVADDDKINQLDRDLIKWKNAADQFEFQYKEVLRKFTVTEQELERSDDRCKDQDGKLSDLTEQVSTLQAACKSAEARYEKASEAEEALLVRVQELTLEKEDLANRDEFTNRSLKTLQVQLESAEDNLNCTKDKLLCMQAEYDQALSDMGNF